MSTRHERRVFAKTADFTIKPPMDAPGTVFTNRGATGTIIATLPTPSLAIKGWHYRFLGHADQIIRIDTPVADTLVTKNDAAADRVSMQTAGELIGGLAEAFCDGVSWFVYGLSVGHTFTVAT